MGKREDLAKQIETLQAELDQADADDVELHVEKNGATTKLRGAHAKKWLKQLGLDDDDEGDAGSAGGDAAGADGTGEADTGPDPDPKPAAAHGYFRTRSSKPQ